MAKVEIDVESNDKVDLSAAKRKFDQFTDDIVSDMESAGKKAGTAYGSGVASGVEKAAEKVKRANEVQVRAVEKLRIAQQKLVELQENKSAKESQRMSVELAYADALRAVADATDNVAAAERNLADERKSSAASASGTVTEGPQFDFKSGLERSKSQLIGEMKSAGIMAGAALAGGLGAALSTTGAAGLFVGLAAMAQSSNQAIRARYSELWDQVKTGAREASSDLADEFIGTAEQLGRTFNTLKPQLQEAMSASQPAVRDLTSGIDRMAKSAMPGLVTAAKASSQATDGIADAMESAGRGVSNFFTESSQGAEAGGKAFASFGRIVERLGSFAGRIISDLANSSTSVFPALEGTVNAAADAVENLASTALPLLASGAALSLGGLTLLLNLANSLITVLGPLAPVIANVATSLKLLDMVTFGGVKGQWESFTGSIKAADGPMGKAKAGLTGLLTTLGPVGIAAGILTLGLGFLSAQQEKAAKKAEDHRNAVKGLATEFERSGGTINAATRKMVGERIINEFGDAEKAAKKLGVGMEELTSAALKQGPAYDDLHKRLEAMIAAGKELQSDPGNNGAQSEVYSDQAAAAHTLLVALEALGGTTDEARSRQQKLADAMMQASGKTNTLAEEFETLADKAASAEDKADALYQIMRRMAGGAPDLEEATRKWEEFIDNFNKKDMNFEEKAAGTRKWADSLVDAQGKINLTTEDGRKLYSTVTDMSNAFQETATSMKANGESADAIRGRLQGMRDQFLDVAQKMGFTRTQAEALARQYGLVPSDVSTLVTSNLAPEIQKAIDLGWRINNLPDGSVYVQSNTRDAQGNIDGFIQRNDGRVIRTFTWNYLVTAPAGSMPLSQGRLEVGGPAASVSAATGGARTGALTVNERGRQETAILPDRSEILLGGLPVGSQIMPHSGNSMVSGNGLGGDSLRVELVVVTDGYDESKHIAELMKKYVKVRAGGSVQKAFGQ